MAHNAMVAHGNTCTQLINATPTPNF